MLDRLGSFAVLPSQADNGARRLALFSIPAAFLLVVFLVLGSADDALKYNSPVLLFVLNSIFITASSFLVAIIAAWTYRASGITRLLLLGSGCLIFGVISVLSPSLMNSPDGPNIAVTLHNSGAFVAALCHFGVGLLFIARLYYPELPGRRSIWVGVAYGGMLVFTGLLAIASMNDWGPPFFVMGEGNTPIRIIVLGGAICNLAMAALLMFLVHRSTHIRFHFWYSMALAMTAIGLFSVFFATDLDSLLNWVGRGAQWLGGLYFGVAVVGLVREGQLKGIQLNLQLARFFEQEDTNYQMLVESATDAIIAVNEANEILLWNRAAERMFGYRASEVRGVPLIDLIFPPDSAEIARRRRAEFMQGDLSAVQDQVLALTARRKNGELFPAEYTTSLRRHGRQWTIILILRDVTERQRTEKEREHLLAEIQQERDKLQTLNTALSQEVARRQEAEQLSGALNALDVILHSTTRPEQILQWAVSQGGAAIRCDTAAVSLYENGRWVIRYVHGFLPEVVGTELLDEQEPHAVLALKTRMPVAIDDTASDDRVNREHMQKWGIRSVLVVPLIAQDQPLGAIFFNYQKRSFTFSNHHLDYARSLGVSVSLAYQAAVLVNHLQRELNQRTKTQHAVEELNRQLERRTVELQATNRELDAFAYSVSHDLRAPLASIQSFARLLSEECNDGLPAEGKTYLHLVHENAEAATKLIASLLAFSRMTRRGLKRQVVEPAALVEQSVQELLPNQSGRRIDFVVGELPPCQADPVLLKQVYANLLSNAVKFTRTREVATIEVGCTPVESGIAYFVKDNGVGFDSEHADKLFGVFQRMHSEEEFEGTGVGLAIADRIIRRHGGRIWADAHVDQGAAFYFTLGDSVVAPVDSGSG